MKNYVLRNYLVALVASMGMAMFGYDGTMFSSIQIFENWKTYFNSPNPANVGAVTTGYSVGAVVFGFSISPVVSDKLGRKWSIGSGAALVIVAAFVMTFTPNIGGFIGGRVLAGAGQGMAMPAGPVYIEEIVFAKTRGRIMSLWQVFYSVGNTMSVYTSLGVSYSPYLGNWDWKIVTLLQVLVPIVLITGLIISPETPRWYVQHGKSEQARKVMATVRAPEDVDLEIEEIEKAVRYEQERPQGSYKQLFFTPSYRRRLILAMIMNVGQQFSGIGSFTNYSGIILEEVFNDVNTVLIIKGVMAIVVFVCPFTAFFFIDKWGRRNLFVWCACGQAVCMFLVATIVTQVPLTESGQHPIGVGIAVVVLKIAFHFFYGPGWGAGLWIWTSEIWPVSVRAHAVAISSQCQQLANIVLGQAFPSFLAAADFYTFYFFMGCNMVMMAVAWFFVVETKGVPLEHIDRLFGETSHVVAVEDEKDGQMERSGSLGRQEND